MINDSLASRFNAYIPEVLLVTEPAIAAEILDFINASVVSIDFDYINSAESAEDVISKSLNNQIINTSANFIQNIIRFGKQCDPDFNILKSYYSEGVLSILLSNDRFKCLIALAYLNAGHASFIATSLKIKETNNGNANAVQ